MLSAEHLPLAKIETLQRNEIIFRIELDGIGRRTHPRNVRQRRAGELVRVPAEQVGHVFHADAGRKVERCFMPPRRGGCLEVRVSRDLSGTRERGTIRAPKPPSRNSGSDDACSPVESPTIC